MKVKDMPKLKSPFIRKMKENHYVVTPEVAPDFKWVFEDDSVMAIEKINGTNVSIVIERWEIMSICNRKNHIPFFSKGNSVIVKGLLNSFDRGYCDLSDGQHFGELVGGRINGNLYNVKLRFGYHSFPLTAFAQMGGMFAFPSVGSTLSAQAI